MTLYFQPRLSDFDFHLFRLVGSGLGNLLFPLARSLLYVDSHQGVLMPPTWRTLKVGPILRREMDRRSYGDLFEHRPIGEFATGLSRRLLLPSMTEQDFLAAEPNSLQGDRRVIVAGMEGRFAPISTAAAPVYRYLLSKSRFAPRSQACDIHVHLRLGDFQEASAAGFSSNTRLPLEWYVSAIRHLQESRGVTSVRLFTDEPDKVAAVKEQVPGLVYLPPVNALVDMLEMAAAPYVVCSNSTFSLWAVFLGDCVAVVPDQALIAAYSLPAREVITVTER